MSVVAFFVGLGVFGILLVAFIIYVLLGLKVVNQYENGVKFTLGKFSGIMPPGLKVVLPIIQSWRRIDMRVKVIDVPDQETITKDNISIKINAVLYYKVVHAKLSVLTVKNFMYATSQIAQTTMRNIVGEVSLDELLEGREKISEKIRSIVDKGTDPWGIKIESVELKHIEIPKEMQRVMARQAEAEREKRSVIIKSQGEVVAAKNLNLSAKNLTRYPGALHLRTLQTINDLSSDKSNTIVYAVPKELLMMFKKLGGGKL